MFVFAVDTQAQNLITREHTDRVRQMAQPARDVGLPRERRGDDQTSRALLARTLRTARV